MTDSTKLFGIWIPGQGWLKTHAGAVAFLHRDVAQSLAERIGQNARPEYIDDSIKDLEQQLLQAEQTRQMRTIWHILSSYFNKRTSSR